MSHALRALARRFAGRAPARDGSERLAGFAEVGTRPYSDGCATSPVAFLEGWYVDEMERAVRYRKAL